MLKAKSFLDPNILNPLFDYCLQIPAVQQFIGNKSSNDLSLESRVFRGAILEALPGDAKGEDVFKLLKEKSELSAPCLIQIYRVAITAGYTQRSVECMFSA